MPQGGEPVQEVPFVIRMSPKSVQQSRMRPELENIRPAKPPKPNLPLTVTVPLEITEKQDDRAVVMELDFW